MGPGVCVKGHWAVIDLDMDQILLLKERNAGGGGKRQCGIVGKLEMHCGGLAFCIENVRGRGIARRTYVS